MYELNNGKCYDSQYFTEWASTHSIKSSYEAKEVWLKFEQDGVLFQSYPEGQKKRLANHEWARLCIAYCFAKIPFKQWAKPQNANGSEVPSFNTMFNYGNKTGEEKFWLAYISQRLFQDLPKQQYSKRDFVVYIQYAWHTGAMALWQRYEKALTAYDGNIAEAKKILFTELANLANQPRKNHRPVSNITSTVKHSIITTSDLTAKMVQILQSDLKKGVKDAKFLEMGVRYDFYHVQFASHVNWDSIHTAFCSAMSLPETSVLAERDTQCGLSYAYRIKILRDRNQWQKLEKGDLQQAIQSYSGHFRLPVCLGADEVGRAVFNDLMEAPHTIIAGATGMGKSALMRTMLHSLFELAEKESTEIAIVYCKEYKDFAEFQNQPNLWQGKIISEADEAFEILRYFVEEMDNRYQQNEQAAKNNTPIQHKKMVLVIDELADLVLVNKEAEKQLIRLAIKARAAGIHLLLATQRPDANILDGQLRDNLNVKIALRVDSRHASEIILKESGAETLQDKGDHFIRWHGRARQFLHGYNV